jgi:molybdate transport system substrate-binding protein
MTLLRWAEVVLVTVLPIACAQEAPNGEGESSSAAADGLTGEILVSAASSLTDAFAELKSGFETAHPGVEVVLNLGGSSALRTQILEGAPIDVFASANEENMDRVVEAGEVLSEPRIFVRNRLQIAVPAGNPGGIEGLDDFANAELRLGLCAEGVPCGDFAREALGQARVVPALDTNEPDVRALLTKIELGELDGGITYVTDVASSLEAVDRIDIPDDLNVVAEYPIAALAGAPNPAAAEAFVQFVLSEEGRAIFAKHGFTLP